MHIYVCGFNCFLHFHDLYTLWIIVLQDLYFKHVCLKLCFVRCTFRVIGMCARTVATPVQIIACFPLQNVTIIPFSGLTYIQQCFAINPL